MIFETIRTEKDGENHLQDTDNQIIMVIER